MRGCWHRGGPGGRQILKATGPFQAEKMQLFAPAPHLKSSIFQRASLRGRCKDECHEKSLTSEHLISKRLGSCSFTSNVNRWLFRVVSEVIPGCSTLSIVQEYHWVGHNQTQRAIIATPPSTSSPLHRPLHNPSFLLS